MTSIEYGGGPTLQQRKDFCNLRAGSHISGYMGYCPQVKFRHGKSYSRQTSDLAAQLPYYNGPITPSEIYLTPTIGQGKISKTTKVFKDEVPRDKIPKSNGDNKYIEKMIPGYSGDVPHINFKFGGTYRALCEECVDEFITEYEKNKKETAQLREISGLFPKLKPIRDDPRVRDNLNLWIDDYVRKRGVKSSQRGPTEPPIPGYTGYIPKEISTNLSTGKRYHNGTERCLEVFRMETKDHFDRLKYPAEPLKPKPERLGPISVGLKEENPSLRIFRNSGIIPQYTGHVHEMEFANGRTVGDASRNLEVCSHHFPSYGLFVRNRDLTLPETSKTVRLCNK